MLLCPLDRRIGKKSCDGPAHAPSSSRFLEDEEIMVALSMCFLDIIQNIIEALIGASCAGLPD
jgi:hypothetical protein